jgi:hypothetical protein
MHEPVRIRAWLQSGVVSDEFLPLDGVVYYQLVRAALGVQDVTVPGATIADGGVLHGLRDAMPFRVRRARRRHWHYACSFAQWPASVQGIEYWTSSFDLQYSDLVDFRGRRGTVAVGSGRFKSYRMPLYYRHAEYVDWYALADADALRRVLRFATHIGKKGSQGWGAVLRWDIEPWPEDWHESGPGGRLMRAVYDPASDVIYGIRPGYWNPRHQFPVRLPANGGPP